MEPYTAEKWTLPQKRYAALITRIDRSVGEILDRLKKRRLDRNTIVILTSDNGPHAEGAAPKFFGSAGGFRGIKGSLHEGGIRVPMIMWRKGWFRKGKVDNHVWAGWDLLPTLADLSGAWRRPRGLDGVSLAPALRGGSPPVRKYLYWELHEKGFAQAIRRGKWKGLRSGLDGPLELYDLADDPAEKKNVAAQNPKIVRELTALLKGARKDSPQWPARKPVAKP